MGKKKEKPEYIERLLPHRMRTDETMLSALEPMKEEIVEPEPELILEDATSIRDAMRCLVRYASDATEALEARIEVEDLDGRTEAEELREAMERVQNLSLEVSEELDAYQDRHGP